ncbi:hypothetical protein [Sediminivirga luteola]|uniref:hypothetical protein n=1 Tax=Sediminivirga luteola TaxID=1774748 RepID=UPI001F568388|nr:hypothetical protein [Sediminivirga luteola]MCI2266003.1 hypothetical protein [Sediminivirga luteola]
MKRHGRWLIPLAVTLAAPIIGYSLILADAQDGWAVVAGSRALWLGLGVLALLFLVPLVGAGFVIAGLVHVYRTSPRQLEKQDRKRSALVVAQGGPETDRSAHQQGRMRAAQLRRLLLDGKTPPALQSFTIPVDPGENIRFEIRAQYSRFYGQTVTYSTGGGFAFGHPLFVAAALTAMSLGDRSTRKAAERQAAQQWRETQFSPVVVTDTRLIINAGGRWLSFYYDAVVAIYPEADHFTLVLDFGDRTEPLRLVGPDAPSVGVWVLYRIFGAEAVAGHPSLQSLEAAPAAEARRLQD